MASTARLPASRDSRQADRACPARRGIGRSRNRVDGRVAAREVRGMALHDRIAFGMSLPHRSPDAIDMRAVHTVAQRAEALGFRDLWVTENTLDHVTCFDPVVVLTYAAAVTSRIRLGASVVVLAIHSPLMVAHQWATLDYVSNGRAILGVGLGRDHHYRQFEVPQEGRVARFREALALIKALWTEQKV